MVCEHYVGNNPNLVAYGLTITGQVRKANEDSCGYLSVPNGELFVVCDGMGGHVGGATASHIAVSQIIEHFKGKKYDDIYQALNDALKRANTQILGEAAANPSLKGMGTTACIVLVDGSDAYIAHVGDSRIYLYEAAKRRLFRITRDHSLVQALVDQGQLDDRDAEHHPQKNVIMMALGTKEDMIPEVYRSPVQPATGDMFLICSDGLSGMVDDNGIEAILSSGATVEEKVQQLVDNANMPGKGLDNITAQLIQVTYSPYPASNHPDHNPRWRNEPRAMYEMSSYGRPSVGRPEGGTMFGSSAQPRKRLSSRMLALIIVGGILILGTLGSFGYYQLVYKNSTYHLNAQLEKIKAEISELEEEKQSYETITSKEGSYNKDLEEINEKLQRKEKKKSEIEEKIKNNNKKSKNKRGATKRENNSNGSSTIV